MGCGQSTLGFNALKRKKKKSSKKNNTRKNNQDSQSKKKSSSDFYTSRNSLLGEDISSAKRRIANKIRPISGPLQPPLHTSTSQLDFFKMLDEKIANGSDYPSEVEEDNSCRSRASSTSKMFLGRKDSRSNARKCSVSESLADGKNHNSVQTSVYS